MIRIPLTLVLVVALAFPSAARAEESADQVIARLVPGRLVDEGGLPGLSLPKLVTPLRIDDGGKGGGGPLGWGLLCPGGGQFANGDWFAGLGVLGSVVLLGGAGVGLIAADQELQLGPAVGGTLIGLAAIVWVTSALEAALGGACLGNCLGGCLTACGLAALLPDDNSGRRRVIRDQDHGRRPPRERPAPSRPEPARPAPARPTGPSAPPR